MQTHKYKVALITGGTKGIGYGIAKALLDSGMRVAITGRSKDTLTEALDTLQKEYGKQVAGFVADVGSYEEQEQTVASVLKTFGRLDVLVANAGVGHFAPLEQLSVAKWDETIRTNLNGVFYSVKAALEVLKKTEGYVITISSLAGTNFFAGGAAYNASKFGVTGFTQAAMLDLREMGIKTTTIMPGSVSTHFNGNTPDATDAWKIQIEDIGQLVVDLLEMNPRTLPSKVEVRPSFPGKK
ncbi:MAG TPA: SDR family oxidoreductase [Flavobacteriaceae bacterium]|nr:SDR family oxidoreductase [Flavobacteriaceae bacterium]